MQLSSLYPEPLSYQLLACRTFLRPLCSLTSIIEKLTLWLSQVPRNLSYKFGVFFSPLVQVSQCWSAVNSDVQWLSVAGLTLSRKRSGTPIHHASLIVVKIKNIVSCSVGCCLQKQGKASPCSNHFESAEKIRLEIFLAGCTRYLRLQLCWFAFVF